jgi:hypothetical protein
MNEWMNVWGVGHNNPALAPWPLMIYCKIWGFHGGDYEECCLLGCGAG